MHFLVLLRFEILSQTFLSLRTFICPPSQMILLNVHVEYYVDNTSPKDLYQQNRATVASDSIKEQRFPCSITVMGSFLNFEFKSGSRLRTDHDILPILASSSCS